MYKNDLPGASSSISKLANFRDDNSLFHSGKRYQLTIPNDMNSVFVSLAMSYPSILCNVELCLLAVRNPKVKYCPFQHIRKTTLQVPRGLFRNQG